MVNKKVRESVRGQLVRRMEDLRDTVSRTAVRIKAAPDNLADLLDQAATEHDRALELAIRVRESHQLREIQETILHIDRGQFGVCVRCSKAISPKRLLLAPMSRLCAPCKEKTELHQNHRGGYGPGYDTECENYAT
jgi:DnaK suppressor protein